jgi:hypothetical protein
VLDLWTEKTGGTGLSLPSTADLYTELLAFSKANQLEFAKHCPSKYAFGKKLAELATWRECPVSISFYERGGRKRVWSIKPISTSEDTPRPSQQIHTHRPSTGEAM